MRKAPVTVPGSWQPVTCKVAPQSMVHGTGSLHITHELVRNAGISAGGQTPDPDN